MTKPLVLILGALVVATSVFPLRTIACAAAFDAEPRPRASSERVTIRGVQVGFGGKYKLGFWTPLGVTVEAHETASGHLEVVVPDGDGVPTTVSTDGQRPIRLAPGETFTQTLYIKPGQSGGTMTVRFVGETGTLAERVYFAGDGGGTDEVPRGLPATARLVVVVGGEIGLAGALRAGNEDAAVATHVAVVSTADELPDHFLGWDGVDMVVLTTSDPGLYLTERFAGARHALSQWLQLGGRLYLFVGQNGEVLLKEGAPLAALLPGRFVRQETVQKFDIEKLCESRFLLPVQPGFRFPVPYVTDEEGRVAFKGGNLPLVIRAIRGFGELTWVGLDVDRRPLDEWNGKPELLRRIFGVAKEQESNVASGAGRLTSLGYTDLVGQLRAALEVFSGVRTFSFAWVIGFTLVYLALLGPLDYVLVHRWGRRPVLTWLTLPLFVILIGGGAYGLARATKGHALRLNQAEVVDVDLPTGLVRGTVWANLYTPRHDRFTLTLDPQLPAGFAANAGETESVLSWLALPGKGLGGVDAAADASAVDRDYRIALDRAELQDLPLPIWSTKSLHAFWTAEASLPLDCALAPDADDVLTGTITNRLDQELANARLYYRGRFCRLETIEPGQSIELDKETLWISAGNDLTGRTLSKEAPPYDPSIRDARRVLQMMMWYNLAGGANYVGLVNRYHARLDFGHLLDAGRAVLVAEVAEVAQPGSRIEQNGEPITDPAGLRLLMFRFVIPVATDD